MAEFIANNDMYMTGGVARKPESTDGLVEYFNVVHSWWAAVKTE